MRLIDAMKKSVKEFRDDAPRSRVRRYVCNVILAILGDDTRPKWISVKERLPGEEDMQKTCEFIVMTKSSPEVTALYYNDGRWFDTDGFFELVTHWMPLPEPPEED